MLRLAPATLAALVRALGDERASKRPRDGEWSAREIVAHLVDGEWAWFRRIRLMATEEEPQMQAFPDADYTKPTLSESLAAYVRNRYDDLTFLDTLAPGQWSRSGRHEMWGEIDILWAVRHLAAHDAEHIAQIARLLD